MDRNKSIAKCRYSNLQVATREGGVDRNDKIIYQLTEGVGRHPRGWRG